MAKAQDKRPKATLILYPAEYNNHNYQGPPDDCFL